MGSTILLIIMLISIVVWAGELIWIYREAELDGVDPLERVSGAAIFFVFAAPIAVYAPDLIDRTSDFWKSVTSGNVGSSFRGSTRERDMPRLIVSGRTIPITQERVQIGRYDNNDLVMDHPTISAYHAEIVARPDGRHELKDRDSRNGTRINGTLIRSAVLKHGDQITLGAMTIHYLVNPASTR